MNIAASVLLGAALSISSLRLSSITPLSRHSRFSEWHQRSLNDAVGPVFVSEGGDRKTGRQQWLALVGTTCMSTAWIYARPTLLNVVCSLAFIAGSWQLPLLLARSRERARQQRIDSQLNDALSELVMGVEAGMTLESVMNMHATRRDTDLSREFRQLLNRVNVGIPRNDALEEMMQRTPTTSVRMFVAAVQQNQKLGTPLAASLRQQAQSSRRRRRQNAEERAARLSLKMIFPTVFCILPVLLIVVVGPAIVRLVHTLP